jgi:hypothetical protein
MSSGLLALLVAGAAVSTVACSKADDAEKKAAWSCTSEQVPEGEVLRCTSSAVSIPPSEVSGSTADTTVTSTWECGGLTETIADCPPPSAADFPVSSDGSSIPSGTGSDAPSGGAGGTTAGTGSDAPAGSDATNGGGSTTGGSSGSSGGGGGSSSGGSSGTSNGKSDSTNGGTSGGGGSGGSTVPDECHYVPDLDYCSGMGTSGPVGSDGTTAGTSSSSSGGTSGTSGGTSGTSGGTSSSSGGTSGTSGGTSSSSGGTDTTKTPPGQNKNPDGTSDGTTSGGASSSGSSGSSGGASSSGGGGGAGGGKTKGKDRHYKCTKDSDGNKTCTSTPDCAPGTHAAACGACVSDSEGAAASDCVPPTEGGCWVTGGGFIEAASTTPAAPADGHDNFGGNAKPMKDGHVSGHWNHVDHGTGNHAKGKPEYIMCRHVDEPGPGQPGGKKGLTANQVYFGGHAQWRTADVWNDGYWFDVVAKDHGEPGSSGPALKKGMMPDTYHITVRKIDDAAKGASGTVVYETRGDLNGGNIQMHPSNNGHPAVNSPLPAWVSLEP